MRRTLCIAAFAVAAFLFATPARSHAQVSIGIRIGNAPVCPYGYYGFSPYRCAPYGYYGPEWFGGGHFIGAGPWYHGEHPFYGSVNRAYDPRFGYHGDYPRYGHDYRVPDDHFQSFHGNAYHDHNGYEAPHEGFHPDDHRGDHR